MKKELSEFVRKEIEALAAMPESEIDFSDIPATKMEDWEGAIRGGLYKPVKQQLTVRIDVDVVNWLKTQADQGRGYQSLLNRILRNAMVESMKAKASG